jgi:hypothetical protein
MLALVLHLGGVGKCMRLIWEWSVHNQESGDLHCYTMVVCEVRPDKDHPDRTRITIGGNRICYPGNVGTNTSSLELVKLLLNSVLSLKGECFSLINLKNIYLDTPMPDPEYVRIKILDIPEEFIEEYNLTNRDRDGWI